MAHRQHHGALGVEELGRRIDDAEPRQRLVDEAVALQQDDPGVGAHQHAGPQRQHDGGCQQGEREALGSRHGQRQRIAQQ
jgi:hypothetical protein